MAENNPYAAPSSPVETPARKPAPVFSGRQLDGAQRLGMIIITLGQLVAVGGTTGFSSFVELQYATALVVAVLSAVAGMAVCSPSYGLSRAIGGACGIAIGVGSFVLADWWLTGRSETSNYEMILVQAVGAVPGILLFLLLRKKFGVQAGA